jgi:hypothetical protein
MTTLQTSNSRCRKGNSSSTNKKQDNIPVSLYQMHTFHPPWIPSAISTCLEWIMTVTIHLLSRYQNTHHRQQYIHTQWGNETSQRYQSERERERESERLSGRSVPLLNSAGSNSFLWNVLNIAWNHGLFRLIMADSVLFDNLISTHFIPSLSWFCLFFTPRLFDVMLWDNVYLSVHYNDIMILLFRLTWVNTHIHLSPISCPVLGVADIYIAGVYGKR